MKIKVDIPGLQQAMQNCQLLVEEVQAELAPAVKEGADLIRDDAKSRIHNITGELSKGVVSQVTWAKNTSKAFAGAGMDKKMNDKFVVYSKQGIRYYIPAAVEYGHRAPGAAVSIERTKRGKRKKSKKQIKARSFMRKAYKARKGEVAKIVENRLRNVLERGRG